MGSGACGVCPNTATYTCVIDGCGKAGRLDDAFGWLHNMRLAGVAPNVATFTALLSACVAADSPPQASFALSLMPADGLDPADLPALLLSRVAHWST